MGRSTPLKVWAISDGRAGMENQVLGLGEAIARMRPAVVEARRVVIRRPFDMMPRGLFGPSLGRLDHSGDRLDPPYPDIALGCGRRVVPLTMALKRRGVFTVQTQDPRAPLNGFDVVVPPAHDQCDGDNVVTILGTPNRLTEARLKTDADVLRAALRLDDGPVATVLLGGDSKDYRMTPAAIDQMVERLARVAEAGRTVLISASRRTPPFALDAIRNALPGAWVWDGMPVGPLANPYFGLLGLAERLFVTEESANMLTDAAFTGAPVHLLRLEGGAEKWTRLHEALRSHGAIRPHAGDLEHWHYTAVRETDRAAEAVLTRWEQRALP